ncbi:hypothetical protein ACJZ2D_007124 [Fusarium nematophilum]
MPPPTRARHFILFSLLVFSISLAILLFTREPTLNRLRARHTSPAVKVQRDDGIFQVEGTRCSREEPCKNGACCGSSFTCGYGPTYCEGNCQADCDAKAPCGQYSESGDEKCPNNACCSQLGFCGIGSDFCGVGCQSNCRSGDISGSPATGDVRDHIIGYYQAWKSTLEPGDCNLLAPTQLPAERLSAINFAHAFIDPRSFEVVPIPGLEASLFDEVTARKSRSPGTEAWISLGGWYFTEDDSSTQPTFSKLMSDPLVWEKFAGDLIGFMNKHEFDGVDIDWKYPGDPGRGGKPEDAKAFPDFLRTLKAKLSAERPPLKISVTAPTSYHYLQWFDLENIAKEVEFFNLMAFDLHGIKDVENPIDDGIFAHSNLTQIDQAIDIFARANDPECWSPGCPYSGPGNDGTCSNPAGVISYQMIELARLFMLGEDSEDYYDAEAAINYRAYSGGSLWVSFENRQSYQAKIDYANEKGLRGLAIWAVDEDTADFSALTKVLGEGFEQSANESFTVTGFNADQCVITGCGEACPTGYRPMTYLNLDQSGKGCPNPDGNILNAERQLCCPWWGAPDPDMCEWDGGGINCHGQCGYNNIVMAVDDQSPEGFHCETGRKVFCCPATLGDKAVNECEWTLDDECPDERPHQETSAWQVWQLGFGASDQARQILCCPEKPDFKNCKWHGEGDDCADNQCLWGKIQLASSFSPDKWDSRCTRDKKAAYCCDPPFGDSALLPVPLEDLFPEEYGIESTDTAVYSEAFQEPPEEGESPNPTEEPFAWMVLVGAPEDVVSLRKRDGSHLDVAICMSQGDDGSNCEDLKLGGVHGTIARLPEHCGRNEWVRVVSFEAVDHPIPGQLSKRAPGGAKVYEIKYDYNFRNLRRDGGEVLARIDASNHPDYWEQVVTSHRTNENSNERRADTGWRTRELAWHQEHGYLSHEKRGESSGSSWWDDRYDFLQRTFDVATHALQMNNKFTQQIYSARKGCPGMAEAFVDARVEGSFQANFSWGFTLVGSLKKMDFKQAHAYFTISDLEFETKSILELYAYAQMESEKYPLLDHLDLSGSALNINGILQVVPYLDIRAQVRALVTASGRFESRVTLKAEQFSWRFPQKDPEPDDTEHFGLPDGDNAFEYKPEVLEANTGNAFTGHTSGEFTLSVTPSVGLRVSLLWADEEAVHSDFKFSATEDLITHVSPAPEHDLDCDGLYVSFDHGQELSLGLESPIEMWGSKEWEYKMYEYQRKSFGPLGCVSWGDKDRFDRREIEDDEENSSALVRRAPGTDVWFPDPEASLIGCPQDFTSPDGDCRARFDDYGSPDEGGGGGGGGSGSGEEGEEVVVDEDGGEEVVDGEDENADAILDGLEKRAKKKVPGQPAFDKPTFAFCSDKLTNGKAINVTSLGLNHPSSGDLYKTKKYSKWKVYGPKTKDCDDYEFEELPKSVLAGPTYETKDFAAEHILEWQTLKHFLEETPNLTLIKLMHKRNPAAPAFWFWYSREISYGKMKNMNLMTLVTRAIPSKRFNYDDLMMLTAGPNGMKETLFGTHAVRTDDVMRNDITTSNSNKAINWCKDLIHAVEYMQRKEIADIYVLQAERVVEYLDAAEEELKKVVDPNFNRIRYEALDFSREWKKWVYAAVDEAITRQEDFLEKWVKEIWDLNMGPPAAAGQAGVNTAGRGVQQNPNVIKRVQALKKADDEFKKKPSWTNPLDPTWK